MLSSKQLFWVWYGAVSYGRNHSVGSKLATGAAGVIVFVVLRLLSAYSYP